MRRFQYQHYRKGVGRQLEFFFCGDNLEFLSIAWLNGNRNFRGRKLGCWTGNDVNGAIAADFNPHGSGEAQPSRHSRLE